MRVAFQLIGLATTPGLPDAVPASIWLNPLENMKDWYCSRASSSHIPASASCSSRLTSGAPRDASAPPSLLRAAGRTPAAAISLIRLSSLARPGRPCPDCCHPRKQVSRDPACRSAPLIATRECQGKYYGPFFRGSRVTEKKGLHFSYRREPAGRVGCTWHIPQCG